MSEKITREMIEQYLDEGGESAMLLDGFDECFIGFSRRINEPVLAVYSWDKIIETLMERDGLPEEDAIEYAEYNILGAWVGPQTPIIVLPME